MVIDGVLKKLCFWGLKIMNDDDDDEEDEEDEDEDDVDDDESEIFGI